MRDPRPGPSTEGAPSAAQGAKLNGVVGLGLDDDGGHRRITRGQAFHVVGGSAKAHASMQELFLRMRETLERQGRTIQDLDQREFEDLARDSLG